MVGEGTSLSLGCSDVGGMRGVRSQVTSGCQLKDVRHSPLFHVNIQESSRKRPLKRFEQSKFGFVTCRGIDIRLKHILIILGIFCETNTGLF